MKTPDKISAHELNAYLDGELDADSRKDVERCLSANGDDQKTLAAYQDIQKALQDEFADVASEPLPERLTEIIAAAKSAPDTDTAPLSQRMGFKMAAGLMLFALGVGSGLLLRPGNETVDGGVAFAGRALGAHAVFVSEVLHPVEVGADNEAHLVKWLTNRLKAKVKAPELQALGFRLVGGRLLSDQGGPAAQLMYQQKNGERVTLYIRSDNSNKDTSFRFISKNGGSAFYWIEGALSYALVGTIPRDQLLTIANKVYSDLQGRSQS